MRFDLVIAGGRICDGTGAKPFRADLGIKGRMIEAVGDLAEAETPERFKRGSDKRGKSPSV